MPINARWTDDCCGKKDYDADLVRLSTRLWPGGGGFLEFNTADGIVRDNADRPDIKPFASAAFFFQEETLCECEFEADTEDAVKSQVEAWTEEQFARIERALRGEFHSHK